MQCKVGKMQRKNKNSKKGITFPRKKIIISKLVEENKTFMVDLSESRINRSERVTCDIIYQIINFRKIYVS